MVFKNIVDKLYEIENSSFSKLYTVEDVDFKRTVSGHYKKENLGVRKYDNYNNILT